MYFLTILVTIAVVVYSVQAKCDGECTVPVKHYEEIGCEPVYSKSGDCCPSHFNCAKFSVRAADQKCYYKGQVYNRGEYIPDDIVESNCVAACRCDKNLRADITCAHIDCPEFLGHRRPLLPGCFEIAERGCCITKTICPPFENIAKCVVDGKTYYDGQRFPAPESAGTCRTCKCKPGFEGKFVEPFCTTINCGVELRASLDIKNNCAPVYYGTDRCCPIDWQCANVNDTIISNEKSGDGEKCSYGDKQLNIGDKVMAKPYSMYSPKISCECLIPPLLTCIQKPHES